MHSILVNATIMVPNICPIIGEYVCVNFVAQQWCNLLKIYLIVALSAYN